MDMVDGVETQEEYEARELQRIVQSAVPAAIRKMKDVLDNADLTPQGAVAAAKTLVELSAQLQGGVAGKTEREVMQAITWDPKWLGAVMGLVVHFVEWGAVQHVDRARVEEVVKEWFGAEDQSEEPSESPNL